MKDTYLATDPSPADMFTGSEGITSAVDAMAGAICYKDGASTGCTSGRIGETEAMMFWNGITADAITEAQIQGGSTRQTR